MIPKDDHATELTISRDFNHVSESKRVEKRHVVIHSCFQECNHARVVSVDHLPEVHPEVISITPSCVPDYERNDPIHV